MALKLKSRELPTVQFRRVLPEWLGPGGECFIEFDARAGGSVNSQHVALTEKAALSARVMTRKSAKIDDDEKYVEADHRAALAINKSRFASLYDACVIQWRSNIQTEADDGTTSAITCDRDTFLALAEERVPEIATAILDLEKEVMAAGVIVAEDDEDTVKN